MSTSHWVEGRKENANRRVFQLSAKASGGKGVPSTERVRMAKNHAMHMCVTGDEVNVCYRHCRPPWLLPLPCPPICFLASSNLLTTT